MLSSHKAHVTHDLATVVRGAATGDEDAWRVLVDRFTPLLRNVARGFRLGSADVDDVVQTTWSRALSHISALNDPEAVAGWLVVIARRESLRLLQRAVTEVLTDEPLELEQVDEELPETEVLEAERRDALRAAVERLPGHQRRLMDALIRMPWRSYDDLSAALAMPVGSIGPTRIRSLERLRSDPCLAVLVAS
jgi:RNA polymerase sigma factor (sigma-70 family)